MAEETLAVQQREKGFAAATSVIAAVFLTGMKLAIGLMTGSLGVLAEAAHSGLDLIAALITFFAVRVSDRPADEAHMYGHGKIENLSALAETFLLLVTCGWIIREAIQRLFFHPREVDPSIWAFLTMGISIIIDFSRSRVLARAAKKYKSQALEADALHFSTDIWSSAVVILGLLLVLYGKSTGQGSAFVRADAVAAFLVALIVVYVSVRLGRRTIDALLDRAPSGLAEEISKAVARVQGVRHVGRIRVREVGSQTFVDLDVAVPRHLSFEESHAVSDLVKGAVHEAAARADVVVHAFPVAEGEGVLERVEAVAAQGHFSVHNVTTHLTSRGMWIDLDLEVDPDLSLERAHQRATDLEVRLREEFGRDKPRSPRRVADVNVHIEPRAEELARGAEMSSKDAAKYVERLHAIRRGMPHTHGVQDIHLQKIGSDVYLSFHLQLEGAVPVSDVHGICEDLENRLRREFPQLGRVVIHAEPLSEEAT